MSDFIIDLETIKKNARSQFTDGAITETYKADKAQVIGLLESALATEWICFLRYTQHQIAAEGIHAEPVAAHFAEHADEERGHAMKLASRIKQLGGQPSMDPVKMSKASHAQYKECDNLLDMIKENLIAERIAVSSYSEMIRYVGDGDVTTRRILEDILADEEEHADDMASLLKALHPGDHVN